MAFETKGLGIVQITLVGRNRIEVLDPSGAGIGLLEYVDLDEGGDDLDRKLVRLTRVNMDGPDGSELYKRQGIARECLRLLCRMGYTVVIDPQDVRLDGEGADGSREIRGFLAEMASERLANWDE